MKKILMVSATILVLAGLCVAASAACPASKSVSNSVQGAVTGLSATPSNVSGRMWAFGNGATINSGAPAAAIAGGAGCANVGTTNDAYWDFSGCYSGYGVYADLSTVTALANGCPTLGTERMVILLEDNTGKYAVISKIGVSSTWDLDQVATQPAISYPTIQNINRTSASGVTPLVFDVTLTGLPGNGNGGYAAADGPATVITGYKIYYKDTASAPGSVAANTGWTLCGGNSTISGATNNATTSVTLPTMAANQYYLMLVMTFDSGIEASYGTTFSAFGPTASPLFANVTADPTTVAWTSGDESRVASYQAYYSLTPAGTYRAIGQPVAALGSGHSYSVGYRVIASTYYVKIKASKTDGTFVWSSPVKVTRLAPAPKPLPGKLLPSKLGVRK